MDLLPAIDLVQTRFVSRDPAALARFYAALVQRDVPMNDYYIEIPTAITGIAFSRHRYTEPDQRHTDAALPSPGETILDFAVDDVDRDYERLRTLDVEWVMGPTDQPWGKRSMMLRDPEGHLVNVFASPQQSVL